MNSFRSRLLLFAFLFLCATPSALSQAHETINIPPNTDPQIIKAFNEGSRLLVSGQSAKAAEQFAPVVVAVPNMPEAHAMYGTALLKSGNVSQGLEELEKANQIKPNMAVVLMNLGVAYQTSGRTKDAIVQFQKYLDLYPNGPYAKNISSMMAIMKTESSRTQGIESSKGKDNYFGEALALGASRWDLAGMPIKVFIADGKSVTGYREEFTTVLKEAFEEWAAATEGKVQVQYISDPAAAGIDVRWTDNPKDLLNPAEGGQALVFPSVNGRIMQVKVQLLTRLVNSPNPLSKEALKQMCLHEIGHSLGLLGHSSDPGDAMFSSVNFEAPHPVLSDRDKKTIQSLYSAPDSLLAEKKVNLNKAAFLGDAGPVNEALKLIAHGVEQMNSKKFNEAIASFELAHKLAPNMDVTVNNLAAAYAQLGDSEVKSKDYAHAQQHYVKASELFKKLGMKNYESKAYEAIAKLAKIRGNQAEATKYENAAKALGVK